MSYILEALKKSDKERQKSNTRPIGSGFTFVKDTPPPRKKFLFGLILTSFMLLAAIILGGGWWWSQQDQVDPTDKKGQVPSASTADTAVVQQQREVSSVPAQQEVAPPVADNHTPLGSPSQFSNEIPNLSDMSADFQTKMAEFKFSGHVYSPEPSLRLIMINDRVVREGDPISTELLLDEIDEDSVIIRHDQGRFRLKLF